MNVEIVNGWVVTAGGRVAFPLGAAVLRVVQPHSRDSDPGAPWLVVVHHVSSDVDDEVYVVAQYADRVAAAVGLRSVVERL